MSDASITIEVEISAKAEGGYKGTYTRKSKSKGGGSQDPDVSSTGDVDVYYATDVKFKIKTDDFTFPQKQSGDVSAPALIEIDGAHYGPGTDIGHFKVGDDQPDDDGKTLKVHDDDSDAPEDTTQSADHRYNLYVVKDGVTYTLDPVFHNRR